MSDFFCHPHNVVDASRIDAERPWGIRVTAPSTDPFNKLVGGDWSREHWFIDAASRDAAFDHMRDRHGYYRIGDDPSIVLEKIDPS